MCANIAMAGNCDAKGKGSSDFCNMVTPLTAVVYSEVDFRSGICLALVHIQNEVYYMLNSPNGRSQAIDIGINFRNAANRFSGNKHCKIYFYHNGNEFMIASMKSMFSSSQTEVEFVQ